MVSFDAYKRLAAAALLGVAASGSPCAALAQTASNSAAENAALGEWRGRLHMSLRQLARDAERLAAALEDKAITATTRRRLEHQHAATSDHLVRLQALLAPLDVESPTAGPGAR